MKTILVSLAVGVMLPLAAQPVPHAVREARVDNEGVLRWTDDHGEVSLFGVNYYPPFTVDYKAIKGRGLDFEQVMCEDVAHFRRLGLTSLRIHCFDRQFSTHDGGFKSNHHIELLDKLIDICARNGIYVILTPIAWWGGRYAPERTGFSSDWTKYEMTANRATWPLQTRFLKEFGEHLNPVTGYRYAEDPAILCFELINEPDYPSGHPDEEVTAYINTLADGLRASGTKKPIFYNSWLGRTAAAGKARIDGVTGCCYPTRLAGREAGHELRGLLLSRVVSSTLNSDQHIARKAKMIYEFDTPDTSVAYLYPAMAKLFRHEGVQIANQFQYDPLCLADVSSGWMAHHLNLVYTPAKALSFAIAAEVFRHFPRGCTYTNAVSEMIFPPFRIDATRNLSQMVTETDFLYTADTVDVPPAPEKLTRVWGVGASTVARASGTGAYFLDHACTGVWRLQLYPDVFDVRDAFTGSDAVKHILLPNSRALTLNLPDLGRAYRVRSAVDGSQVVQAADGVVLLQPGDYIVENVPDYGERERRAIAALSTPPYGTRLPSHAAHVVSRMPRQWCSTKPLSLDVQMCGVRDVTAHVMFTATDEKGKRRCFPRKVAANSTHVECLTTQTMFTVKLRREASEWEFFDAEAALRYGTFWGIRGVRKYSAKDSAGGPAFGFAAEAGTFSENGKYTGVHTVCEGDVFRKAFDGIGAAKAVLFRARATDAFTSKLEVVFKQEDKGNWGVILPLTTEWRTIRVPVGDLRPYWTTKHDMTAKPDPRQAMGLAISYGRWLCLDFPDKPHGFEISSIKLEF